MLFNSLEFLIFFLIVVVTYFSIPHKYRWSLLLILSCIFYISFIPIYIFVLFFLITIDYFAGIFIEKSEGKKRKIFLIISIISTSSALFFFKYFNFFSYNLENLSKLIGWNYSPLILSLALPIGLSFHTFQSLSYVIEVYRGRQKAEKNFGIYALYVMFFPQLVAGPIERPYNLLHQFYEEHKFEFNRIIDGLGLMIWGFFKKIVVADRLAAVVNIVYGDTVAYQGTPLILATFFFAFQIYYDFSGYSDIAIGSARVLGFNLMRNFNRPYFSKSIPEFWKRWHISLSTWFRDYVYIPLGGNRVPIHLFYFNLFVVFLLSGLWHGANWTFVMWGFLNCIYIILFFMTQKIRERIFPESKLYNIISIIFTFILVGFGWIFFRANNISEAFFIITNLFSRINLNIFNMDLKVSKANLLLSFTLIFFIEFVHYLQEKDIDIKKKFLSLPRIIRWGIYLIFILIILLFGVFKNMQFIYFQF